MSVSPGGLPSGIEVSEGADPRPLLHARVRRGGSWFIAVGALSGFNTLMQAFDAKIHFIFGLGITDVVNRFAQGHGQNGLIATILVDGVVVALLVLCGVWARNGSPGAFMVGMIAYTLDGALFILYGGLIQVLVHGYALWRVWDGYAACSELAKLNLTAQPGPSPVELP